MEVEVEVGLLVTPPRSRERVLDGVLVDIVGSTEVPSTLTRGMPLERDAEPTVLTVSLELPPATEVAGATSLLWIMR